MKTNSIILLALAAVLALSCSVREDDMIFTGGTVSFKATLADAPFTKTVLQSDGSVYWSPGDAINLFYGATGSARLDADNTEPAAQTSFTGTLEGFVPDGSSYFWAVYPYSADNGFDGSAVTLTLPDVQTAVAGTFADDLFVTMAHSKDYTLQFYNVCGGVKFSVAGEGIKYVTFKGNSDEILAGKVKVGIDEEGKPQVKEVVDGKKEIRVDAPGGGTFETGKWYYVVAFPDTLASGYTMSFYDDKLIAERVENKTVTLKRSIWGKLTEADDVAITATKWLTFTSEGTTTISLLNNDDNAPKLYYSFDKTNWIEWNYSALEFTSSAPLYLCGDNPDGFCPSITQYSKFVGSGSKFSVSGDIMSLLSYDKDIKEIPCDYCFGHMFDSCKLLTKAPDLPATALAPGCYFEMFHGCESLETAPDLPATTLVEGCYMNMFSGCTSLAQIKCLATDVSATDCTTGWMKNVPMGGTFTKDKNMHGWKGGQDGMPYEWFVENSDGSVFAVHYMIFIAGPTQSASDYLLTLKNYGGNAPIVYYSNDAQNWKLWGYGGIPVSADDALFICGDNPDGFSKECSSNTWNNNGVFSSFNKTGEGDDILFNVYGDVMSLISKDVEVDVIPCDYCFCRLFKGTPGLAIAPGISATTLTKKCYMQMFFGDATLVAPPEGLPAMAMKDSCYFQMFAGCNKMSYAPELPATTLADACYFGMFDSCTELVDAPDLPATTLAKGCYSKMFSFCLKMQSAPLLPAPTLVAECYYQMFKDCNQLCDLTCLATDISAPDCTSDWFDGAPPGGIFTKPSDMTSWTSGASGIPAGWTIVDFSD